jgi:hypothetical protein
MTSTTTNGIKCGKCKEYHPTANDVRACYGLAAVEDSPRRFPAAAIGPKGTGDQPATEKQVAFIARLAQERGVATPVAGTKKAATAEIERLLALPKAAPSSHPDSQAKGGTATEGMHKVGDEIFKVQKAVHGSGHLYCKRLVPGEGFGAKATFVYAPGMMKQLSAATKMSLEEAKAFGALYGTCCVCGRTLTDEKSIAAGIGPVCAGKGMWA